MFRRCLSFVVTLLVLSAIGIAQDKTVNREFDADRAERNDEQVRRQQWFQDGRTSPQPGVPAAELLNRAHQQRLQLRTVRRSQASGRAGVAALAVPGLSPAWSLLGPSPMISSDDQSNFQDYGNVSGRITSVAIDQSDPTGNTVYVGAAYGGVWKSGNAADPIPTNVTWTPLTDSQVTLATGAIAVSPDGSTLLVGTGEPNGAGDSYYGLGIIRGTNMKTSPVFSQIASSTDNVSFKGVGFSHFAWNTNAPLNVVASVANTSKVLGSLAGQASPNTNVGLFFSDNAGVTWTKATVTDNGSPVTFNSVNGLVYNAVRNQYFAAVRTHGIFTSTDNGHTWTRLPNQPTPITPTLCPATNGVVATCPLVRGELAVTPGRDEMFLWFVGLDASGNEANESVWVTRDGGVTWHDLGTGGQMTACGDLIGGCGVEQGTYNLELAAVPNGTGTDLYAGAINIFKCSLPTNGISCGANWLNTTHVYGCSTLADLAHVHPDQHGIDFLRTNPNIMVFGNDGGVYRSLTASTGITTGTCGQHNAYDNLNTNLALTQFVWFSHDPTADQIILGGTQDNGSPSLNPTVVTPANPQLWTNYLAGDGGYTAIDPNNTNTWAFSQPAVTGSASSDITVSVLGVNSRGSVNRQNTTVSSGTLGGDDGAFYTPFILDPGATSKMIVGTCRVWRGPAVGGAFAALSGKFSAGTATNCRIGSGDTTIRALAAGGVTTANGSQVIYAGTASGSGRVFVTVNADGGAATWSDRTGAINPNNFQISSIFVDANDKSGRTAFVTIMGFGGGHLFRTTDAGVNWTNVTGDLPDAPADSFTMDPGDPTVWYVATDTGVYMSTNGGTNWTEYSATSAGALPNVAITHLDTINNTTLTPKVQKLRVSTYGRGIWETDLRSATTVAPDYAVTATGTTTQTVTKGGSTTYTFSVGSANGFTGQVTFGCALVPTATTCSFSPATAAPGGTTTLTLKTTAASSVQRGSLWTPQAWSLALLLPGIVVIGWRRKRGTAMLLAVMFAALLIMPACGGGGGSSVVTPPPPPPPPVPGTPSGTSTVVVTATSGSVVHSATVTLTVQ